MRPPSSTPFRQRRSVSSSTCLSVRITNFHTTYQFKMPPKKEILEKHFPGKTAREAQNAMIANFLTLFEDVSYSGRTKLQLPYEAPNHPVLPSLEEIQEAYAEWRKTKRRTLGNTFKIGECMVKSSSGATLLQVGCLASPRQQRLTRS
jgi:hypothetical protein